MMFITLLSQLKNQITGKKGGAIPHAVKAKTSEAVASSPIFRAPFGHLCRPGAPPRLRPMTAFPLHCYLL